MKLFYDPISTTSRPVLMMLVQCEIDVDHEVISILSGEQHDPAFRAINPKGMVPALAVSENFVLTEVAAILRYLARHHAPALYPPARIAQARVDEMISWFSTDVHLALDFCTVYPRTLIRGALEDGCARALEAFAEPRVAAQLDFLDSVLAQHSYVTGPSLTIADLLGYAYLSLAELIEFDFTRWPNVRCWLDLMAALPGRSNAYAAFEGLLVAERAARVA